VKRYENTIDTVSECDATRVARVMGEQGWQLMSASVIDRSGAVMLAFSREAEEHPTRAKS